MRAIPDGLKALLRDVARAEVDSHPMAILRTGVSYLAHFSEDADDNSPEAELHKAKRLLAHTTLTVATVGTRLGFDEATNFVKFFRRATGTTPGSFRDRYVRT